MIIRRAILCIAVSGLLYAPAAFAENDDFSAYQKRSGNLGSFPKWTGVIKRYGTQKKKAEKECSASADNAECTLQSWKELIEGLGSASLSDQLERINRWGNAHAYIVDQQNWGMNDFWATPVEFMKMNGDCEDYAIAKYYSLRALGVPADQLRIVILQDLNLGGVIHAVLAVEDGGDIWLLDNQSSAVTRSSRVAHYKPIYGVNEAAWWIYKPSVKGKG